MKRCQECDGIVNWDGSQKLCRRHAAEFAFNQLTGLSMDDLPDELPIEDFIDEDGELDFDGITSW